MQLLKNKLAEKLPALRADRATLLKEHGDKPLSSVAIEQVLGGMRAVPALLCDTSSVSSDEGLRIRNIACLDLTDKLPEDIFFLLCTGELPNDAEREEIRAALAAKAVLPDYIWSMLRSLPSDTHPMVMLSMGILALERDSVFRREYEAGASKDRLWEATLEDMVSLVGGITTLAAGIYRIRFNKGELINPSAELDYGANFAQMLGLDQSELVRQLVRLYLVLHSDHEGGNVSAMTAHTVSSALSDAFYSVSAGLNGLAGPLHGLANQECLRFILDIREHFQGVPTDEQLVEFAWNRLNSGQVIPGYGHAVLRVTDPRFVAFYQFAENNNMTDENVQIVMKLYRLIPDVLRQQGKAKNPWPNVDAASGSLLYAFGMTEFEYYTVMFGVSRAMGICSQILFHRMIGSPIVRPKSLTMAEMKAAAGM